jgi:archaemetzincin
MRCRLNSSNSKKEVKYLECVRIPVTTPVHIILALTSEGAERYLSRKRGRRKKKHQAGISGPQVSIIIRRLSKHGFECDEPEMIEVRREWMHRGRRQIKSEFLIEMALGRAEDLSDKGTKIVVVTDADMYATGSKYLISRFDPERGVVVVSTMRIRSEVRWRFLARLLKEILHGLGHTLGLKHCRNKECVMNSSKLATDTDIKSQAFCERCRERSGGALGQ